MRLASAALLIFVFVVCPTWAVAHAYTQDVYLWNGVTSGKQMIGPVTDIRIHYNALRYTKPGTTVSITLNPPLDYASLLKNVAGVIPGAAFEVPTVPPLSQNPSCNLTIPAKSLDVTAMQGIQTTVQACMKSLVPPATNAKSIADDIAYYQAVALATDKRLGQQSPSDQLDPAVLACAQAMDARLTALLKSSPVAPPGVSACTYADNSSTQMMASNLCTTCWYGSPDLLNPSDETFVEALGVRVDGLVYVVTKALYSNSVPIALTADTLATLKKSRSALADLQNDGAVGKAYHANYLILKSYQAAADYAVGRGSDNYFVYDDLTSGKCSNNATGEKRTVSFTATDLTGKSDAKVDAAAITCLGRDVQSAGAGYTGLRATTYTTENYINGTTVTSKIVEQNNNGQFTAAALTHWCVCGQRTEDPAAFGSVGVTTAGSNPIGVFAGLSGGFAQRFFLSVGGNYGYENQLDYGYAGEFVPTSFKATTYHIYRIRWAAIFSVQI
jgi:hypothetical protein